MMRNKILPFLFVFVFVFLATAFSSLHAHTNLFKDRQYYELRIYHLANARQEAAVDQFLQQAFLPALHKKGIQPVGVFKPVGNDTAADRRIIVLIPHKSLTDFMNTRLQLQKDTSWMQSGNDYVNAAYDQPPYLRMETILLYAFEEKPQLEVPHLQGPRSERVYELRSYEGPTEKLSQNKIRMFNKGNEVSIFKRLGFNAVFYAEVLAGSHMPNLMYMTTFDNMASRNQHWDAFRSDAAWKNLSAMPEYQHNTSKSDILFLTPTSYSDY